MQEQEAEIARTDVEVKGWRNGLLLLIPPDGSWDIVMERVDARLDEARARSFWRGAQTTIDCGLRFVSLEDLDTLLDRVKGAYGLVPIAIVASDPATRAAGEKLAMVSYEEMPIVRKPARREFETNVTPSASIPEIAPVSPAEAPEKTSASSGVTNNALYLYQTVRSGQRIVSDGHIVICGDVNAGAELIARGDIVVFGTLRGVAHAGAYGDESARIVAGSLRPTQLRIAGKIARSPEEVGKTKGGAAERNPEVARIENGEIQIFPQ